MSGLTMNVRCFRDDVDPPRLRQPSVEHEKRGVVEEQKKNTTEEIKATKADEGVVNVPPESPKPQPLAFSIDFNDGKSVDKSKFENFMKRSQARHQRVQSMSASWTRPSPGNPPQQRIPMSAKLPRKAHGYHSEGYFSSDQEDTTIGASKNRQIANENKQIYSNCNNNFSPSGHERDSFRNKHLKLEHHSSSNNSPTAEKRNPFERSPDSLNSSLTRTSKSPIVDGIMSRSDILPSRQGLNLPIKHPYTTAFDRTNSEMINNPIYGNCLSNYALRSPYIIEQSPNDAPMLADTSSPELDLLTPDTVALTPGTPLRNSLRRNSSGHFRSCSPAPRSSNKTSSGTVSLEQITRSPSVTRNIATKTVQMLNNENDGNVSPSSTVSEAGTYTIEADHYTEEQKALMNIDEMFGTDEFKEPIMEALGKLNKPMEIQMLLESKRDYVITKEPRFACGIREELLLAKNIPDPIRKVSTDKNVLEISCCYESPTESHNEPPQIVKPPKTAKSYLDKIKSRVKNISEKTFQKVPKTHESQDVGSFTSVTASGILSSNQKSSKPYDNREKLYRKNSLTKSQIDATEYIHHMPRDNLVLQTVSNESFVPKSSIGCSIISNTILTNTPQMDEGISMKTPEQILVGKLSHISLNRCQGDKSWIQDWADSVKKHNKETVMAPKPDLALTGLPPVSPRHSVILKGLTSPVRSISSSCSSPSKIPSPVGTMVRERPSIPDILSSTPDTESYLASTQSVISNLQAKLQKGNNNKSSLHMENSNVNCGEYNNHLHNIQPTDKCNNFTKLPVSQLSRSNSLNYRLHRRNNNACDSSETSPLRNPGRYFITGNQTAMANTRLLLSNLGASKSLDTDTGLIKSDQSSPIHRYNRARGPDVVTGRLEQSEGVRNVDKTHARNRSFDARNTRDFIDTLHNVMGYYKTANIMTQSLNAEYDKKHDFANSRGRNIDQIIARNTLPSNNKVLNVLRSNHTRGGSDTASQINTKLHNKHINATSVAVSNSPIRRSSSFNVVNKNNNVYSNNDVKNNPMGSPVARNSRTNRNFSQINNDLQARNNTPEVDYLSEDSDNVSTGGFYSDYDRRSSRRGDPSGGEVLGGTRYNRAFALRRARLDSPDLRSQNSAPANSPRCPGTPEMRRKFNTERGTSQTRVRVTSRDARRPEATNNSNTNNNNNASNNNPSNAASLKKKAEPIAKLQISANRLTRSCSTAKDFQPRGNERNSGKKQANTKEVEFTNWKKRASYDPLKAAQEGKKKTGNASTRNSVGKTTQENLDEVASPSGSSPSHRPRSLHSPSADPALVTSMEMTASDTEDNVLEDRMECIMPESPTRGAMRIEDDLSSGGNITCLQDPGNRSRRQAQYNSVTLTSDYVTKFKVNPTEPVKRPSDPKLRLISLESESCCERSRSAGHHHHQPAQHQQAESDTATTTTTTNSGSSDQELEPEWETRPANVTMRGKSASVPPQHRHSGDFSVSSSTTSASKDVSGKLQPRIQPRYMDISRFKSAEPSPAKNFLRRDPSKTYVAVLPSQEHRQQARRNTARQEQEMKIKELEKWKRRASYDPRKAAAQAKAKPSNKSPSNSVLRSQSFHGPMTHNSKFSLESMDRSTGDNCHQDANSDNEF